MLISEIVKKGWEVTKKDFWFFFSVIIVFFFIMIGFKIVLSVLDLRCWLGQILSFILSMWLSIGLIIISLKKVRGKSATISDLFVGGPYVASYMGASLIYFLMMIAGVFLLVFPAIIWSLKFMFFEYLIIDKNMKAIDALKMSSKMTDGIKWDLLGVNFVLFIIGLSGLLCFVIGIFWAIPITMIANAALYLKVASLKLKK